METEQLVSLQRVFFLEGKTREIVFRKEALRKLLRLIKKHENEIEAALFADLGKSAFETYTTEIGLVYEEIRYHLRKLNRWSKTRNVATNQMVHAFSRSRIIPQPKGCSLIISPWNYPFQLSIMPLIAAITSGCTAIIKPSEFSVNTSKLLEKMLNKCFEPEYIAVLNGDQETSKSLLKLPHDLIFFTGSPIVGKVVMQKAAEHLCPVVLELGGKSPVIVCKDADISKAAKRIIWGKLINAGQTCIAPDYILAHGSIHEKLVKELEKYIRLFWGSNPVEHPSYPNIINEKHYSRLKSYLATPDKKIVVGQNDDKKLKLAPVIWENPSTDLPVMQEELFGPVIPVIEYSNDVDAIAFVNARPRPLALYIFSSSKPIIRKILNETTSGGAAVNDVIMHIANNKLPFGGVGNSGMGNYHGKAGFDAFTHYKSVLWRCRMPEPNFRYMPHNEKKLSLIKRILK